MTKEEFFQRALTEFELRCIPSIQPQFTRHENYRYLIHLIEAAMVFGQYRLCDQLGEQLSPFVAEMFRPTEKIAACDQQSWPGHEAKQEQEEEFYQRWKHLIDQHRPQEANPGVAEISA